MSHGPLMHPTHVLPTEAEIADALIQHETSGMCHYGRICGTCEALQGVTYDTAFVRRCATDEAYSGELLSAREFDSWLARVKADVWDESSKATSEAIFSSWDARGVCISWVIPANPYRESEG